MSRNLKKLIATCITLQLLSACSGSNDQEGESNGKSALKMALSDSLTTQESAQKEGSFPSHDGLHDALLKGDGDNNAVQVTIPGSDELLTVTDANFQADKLLLKLPANKSCADVVISNTQHSCYDNVAFQLAEVTVQGPFYFNLLTQEVVPPITGIILPTGHYQGVSVSLFSQFDPNAFADMSAEHSRCGDDVAFCVMGEGTENGLMGYGFTPGSPLLLQLLNDGFEAIQGEGEQVLFMLDAQTFIDEVDEILYPGAENHVGNDPAQVE